MGITVNPVVVNVMTQAMQTGQITKSTQVPLDPAQIKGFRAYDLSEDLVLARDREGMNLLGLREGNAYVLREIEQKRSDKKRPQRSAYPRPAKHPISKRFSLMHQSGPIVLSVRERNAKPLGVKVITAPQEMQIEGLDLVTPARARRGGSSIGLRHFAKTEAKEILTQWARGGVDLCNP